jgi:hypothetical protein
MSSFKNSGIRNIRFRQHLSFAFLIFNIVLFYSCKSHPKPYSILEISGKGEIYNYSKSPLPIMYESDSINSTALLASNGDLIIYDENNCFSYRDSSRNKFSIKTIKNEGFINGKINSIRIPANDSMIRWFKQMRSTDISALGFLYLDSGISENYIPYLKNLAETKPDIGLGYDGDIKEIKRILEIFKPGFIIGVQLSQEDFSLLSGLTSLESLSASLDDSVYTVPLPAMPELEQLVLTKYQKGAIKNDFLVNNRQIEKLSVMGSDIFDLSFIRPLKGLKELIINGADTIENFDLIRNHKQLELLSVTGKKLSDDIALKELPGIRWMTFHDDATQDEFNSFIGSHPGLEVVEIMDNDTIKNLQPLSNIRKLLGLTITDTLTDFAAVKSLKNLKYLSLPDKILNDTIRKTELQKSLPYTRIVSNKGVCLGSGWLLLLIPLILVFKIFGRQKSPKLQQRL